MSVRSRFQIRDSWLVVLSPIVALLFVKGFAEYLLTEWPAIATDPAFFQHTGWYILQGGVPYVDVWDVNPPVPFGIAAVLAAVSGGDMLVLHALSSALTTLVGAVSVILVGWVAKLVTGEDAAAIAAGLTMLVVPEVFLLSPEGIRAQFYALFFGTLALALILRDRPFLAGAVAALSAGSWQMGIVFAPLIVGMAYQRNGTKNALSAIAGGSLVAGVVIIVFAAAGALVPMIVQAVRAPLTAGSPNTLAEYGYTVLLVLGYGSILLPVAFFGWGYAGIRNLRDRWWLPAGGAILTYQVLTIDMDGSTDALLWLAFVALGVAIAVERMIKWQPTMTARHSNNSPRTASRGWIVGIAIIIVIGLLVPAGIIWHNDSPYPQSTLQTMKEDAEVDEDISITPDDADVPSMQTIYWEQLQPETCHYRLSWNEIRWISITDDQLDTRECSGWPTEVERA
ncbi:DolP-mannose mannosyltransferase [Natronococcus sp. JC468]|uniref:DolP-mannose mannosyltransferase n=1 Tax=Natronococcus sp. JC468 TaxID=1961921 RepID=UPI0014398587|nr:DolP-mannose mannosyltransferase [Natronococcus sp. JC468]NKE37882.1 DolP-mannose mannosyltransferase [Natronococcus sp. JC468]